MLTPVNHLARIGVTDDDVRCRAEACFRTIFEDPQQGFYHAVDADTGCLEDTGNHDARTEGISYGMMMCVQMDRQALFNRLWRFAKRYMELPEGPHRGYFAWSVGLDGRHNAEGPAPDGEEYFAMALLMAGARWGDGEGELNYTAQARSLLHRMLWQDRLTPGGMPMWNRELHLIKFIPDCDFSDPSYHLPHFYELFALAAEEEDRPFWRQAAQASRAYIARSAHPHTGMSPEYAAWDGTPHPVRGDHGAYYSDAYRVAMNIALDAAWFGPTESLTQVVTRLQNFFHTWQGDYREWAIDGTPLSRAALHPVAIDAVLAAASIASASPWAEDFLRRFWHTPLRQGDRRYYDNCLYFFCLLMLGGLYRPWVA